MNMYKSFLYYFVTLTGYPLQSHNFRLLHESYSGQVPHTRFEVPQYLSQCCMQAIGVERKPCAVKLI